MAGALIGADLNDFLPDIVIVVMLLVLLTYTAYKTITKANKLHEQETHEAISRTDSKMNGDDDEMIPLKPSDKDNNDNDESVGYQSTRVESHIELSSGSGSADQEEDSNDYNAWADASRLITLFVVVTGINLLKGTADEGGGGPMGLSGCGETCFWMSEILIFLIIFVFAVFVRRSVLFRLRNGILMHTDIDWDEENTICYPAMAIVAGLAAGLFGIGACFCFILLVVYSLFRNLSKPHSTFLCDSLFFQY